MRRKILNSVDAVSKNIESCLDMARLKLFAEFATFVSEVLHGIRFGLFFGLGRLSFLIVSGLGVSGSTIVVVEVRHCGTAHKDRNGCRRQSQLLCRLLGLLFMAVFL